MPLQASIFADEAELGKKDDDRKPTARGATPLPSLSPRWKNAVPRLRKRRFIAFALALIALYFFFKNMPTGLTPVSERVDRRAPGRTVNGMPLGEYTFPRFSTPSPFSSSTFKSGKPSKPEPGDGDESEQSEHYYNGDFELTSLSQSLQSLARNLRFGSHNKNVLFAAANLQSASRLIPLVCDMARWNRNTVHFAYMGRDDVSLDLIQELNGADIGCEVNWHDARPDYSMYSSDDRMRKAMTAALDSLTIFLHPQIYFCDETRSEDFVFVEKYRAKVAKEDKPLLELPKDSAERLMWITRLDTGSLNAWHKAYIDILVQAPSNDVGSLKRFLKSLEVADYSGVRYPHLTIEIPPDMDAPSRRVLNEFVWPPVGKKGERHSSQLTLRKRIAFSPMNPLEASIRTVESFYPARPFDSHVLLLSPRVELSPMFYHYLYYHLLEYHYSFYNGGTLESENLMGISLTTPTLRLDQKTPFVPPPPKPITTPLASTIKTPTETAVSEDSENTTPFMWQAPDISATLFFGHRWQELHSFLSLRISQTTWKTPRELPPSLPAFAEPLFEIMRLRGYTILYPNLPAHSVAIDHPLSTVREEFLTSPSSDQPLVQSQGDLTDPYELPVLPPQDELLPHVDSLATKPLATSPLTRFLPTNADLPELPTLPLLNPQCEPALAIDLNQVGRTLAADFRYMIGGCEESATPLLNPGSAEDLFCDSDGEPLGGSMMPPNEAAHKGMLPLDLDSLRRARERGRELAKERAGTSSKNLGEVGGTTGKSGVAGMDPDTGTSAGGVSPGTGGVALPHRGSAFSDHEQSAVVQINDQSELRQEEFKEHLKRQRASSGTNPSTDKGPHDNEAKDKEKSPENTEDDAELQRTRKAESTTGENQKKDEEERPAGW